MSALSEKVLSLRGKGLTRAQWAAEAGCSRVYVWMVLKAAGYPIPKSGKYPRRPREKAKPSLRRFSWEGQP